MSKITIVIFCVLTSLFGCSELKKSSSSHKNSPTTYYSAPTNALAVIDNFYKDYLAVSGSGDRADLPFSQSFTDLLIQNRKVCQEKAGSDICGWGSNGDIYLDAEKVEPNLNYENSGFKVQEILSGVVEVKFNIFPSLKNGKRNERTIRFNLIKENGNWVVDNIKSRALSAREEIQQEIKRLKK